MGDVKVNGQLMRDGVRRKDFEKRVNNIDSINDKINNLLNMVNKRGQLSGYEKDSPCRKYQELSAKVQKQTNTPKEESKYYKYERTEY